jgi:hypothetical protein
VQARFQASSGGRKNNGMPASLLVTGLECKRNCAVC